MKKITLAIIGVGFLMLGVVNVSQAALIDRGGGLIYDEDQNITWLQDANYAKTSGYDSDGVMSWDETVAWAGQLVYAGYSDWRLPMTIDGAWTEDWSNVDYDGTAAGGYNIITSEMGYMYYINLGNLARYAIDGTNPQPGWGLSNTSPFINLEYPATYWSGTEYALDTSKAWNFVFYEGYQDLDPKGNAYAWAVRDGDSGSIAEPSPVPEPSSLLLMGFGGIITAFIKRRRKA